MGAFWDFILQITNNVGAGVCLLICGAVWVLDTAFEASRREGFFKRDDNWNFDVTTLLKILTIIACSTGFIFIIIGILGYFNDTITTTLTSTSLIILGFLTILKPVNDLPIASMIGFFSATLVALIIATIIYFSPLELADFKWQWGVFIVIVLVIVFIASTLIAKFWVALPKLISKIVSWPVVSVIGAAYSFILGGLVLAGIYV
ncbi:MAG: hypothetical protein JW891_00425 [Candidatus Lokiarchaeota archaeon]|nr:hypothetical protein [Candidatus Lokiarchaeota archaeon]